MLSLVGLFEFDPSGLVPLVKEIDELDGSRPRSPHLSHPAAKGGREGKMGRWLYFATSSLAV